MRCRHILFAGLALAIAASPAASFAKTVPGLEDLIGMRGSSLEAEMTSRGYTFTGAHGPQYWWSDRIPVCAAVSISDGRVASIVAVYKSNCGKDMPATPSHGTDGLAGIVGMNGINAFDEMINRGFKGVDTLTSGNTLYGIYYNPRTRVCVRS